MGKRNASVLGFSLEGGTPLEVNLKRQRISNVKDLRTYVESALGHRILEITAPSLQVGLSSDNSWQALTQAYPDDLMVCSAGRAPGIGRVYSGNFWAVHLTRPSPNLSGKVIVYLPACSYASLGTQTTHHL